MVANNNFDIATKMHKLLVKLINAAFVVTPLCKPDIKSSNRGGFSCSCTGSNRTPANVAFWQREADMPACLLCCRCRR